MLASHYSCTNFRHFERELDRALGEKQKLQMEIEEHRAAMEELEAREAKMRLEAKLKENEIMVLIWYNTYLCIFGKILESGIGSKDIFAEHAKGSKEICSP